MNEGTTKEPTVSQRQAMAKLAEESFAKRIQEARDEEGALVKEITVELKNEFGIDAVGHQIDSFKKQIDILEDKQGKLGWGYNGFDDDSKAGRLLKGRVSQRSTGVKKLDAERKKVLAAIWTCQRLDELEALVEKL